MSFECNYEIFSTSILIMKYLVHLFYFVFGLLIMYVFVVFFPITVGILSLHGFTRFTRFRTGTEQFNFSYSRATWHRGEKILPRKGTIWIMNHF